MTLSNRAVIDLRIPSGFSITLGGTDITALVISGSISKPEFNPSATQRGEFNPEAQLWQGSMVIRQPRTGNRGVQGFSAFTSIDSADNALFKAWASPLIINDGFQQVATLRLAKDCKVTTDGTATLELRHLAYSLAGQAPRVIPQFGARGIAQPYGEDLNFNVRTTADYAQNIITNAINASGLSVFSDSDIDFSGVDDLLQNTFSFGGGAAVNGFSVEQPGDDELPVEKANKLLLSSYQRGIESRHDERLYLTDEFPIASGTPVLTLAPQQLLSAEPLEYDADSENEVATNSNRTILIVRKLTLNKELSPPSERVPNPAGIDDSDDPEEWPKIIPVPGIAPGSDTPLIVEIRTENEPTDLNTAGTVATRTRSATVTAARFYILGTGTDTTFIPRGSETTTENVAVNRTPSAINNQMTSRVNVAIGFLHDLDRERFDGDLTQVTVTTTEEWEYNSLGSNTEYKKTVVKPRQVVLEAAIAGDNTPTTAVIEGFRRVLVRQGILKQYLEVPFKLVPQGVIDNTDTDTMVADPDFDVAENIRIAEAVAAAPAIPSAPASYVLESASAQFDDPSPITFRTQTTANSKESAAKTATVIAAAAQQRRQAVQVQHAISPLFDYRSFRRINLDNGREAMQVNVTAPGLIFDNRSIRLNYLGYKIGTLANRITLPKIPIVASAFGGNLTIAGIGDRTSTAALPINTPITPITLQAFNGQAPYSFGATGLPVGLSIVGNQIVGTPTATGSAMVTVTVTDDNLNTAQTTFTLATVAEVGVTPAYSELVSATGGMRMGGQSQVIEQYIGNSATATATGVDATFVIADEFSADSAAATATSIDATFTVNNDFTVDTAPATATGENATFSTTLPQSASLVAFHDSTDSSSITETGSLVSQWNDKSGNGNHLTATGSERPTLVASGINGAQSIEFNGTSNEMTWSSALISGTHTIIIVFESEIESSEGTLIGQFAAGQAGRLLYVTNQDDGGLTSAGQFNAFVNGVTDGAGGSGLLDSFSISATKTIFSSVSSGLGNSEGFKIYKDGVEQDSGTLNSIYTGGNTTIGNAPGITFFFDGQISKIAIWDVALTDAERTDAENFLS